MFPQGLYSQPAASRCAALSVIGRSANSTGNVADIVAVTDGHVLRRSGTTLGFGTIATEGITDDSATNAKLADMAANTIKGRITASTGDPEDLTAANVRTITGQSWVEIDKQVLSTAAAVLIIPLTGTYRFYRLRFFFRPNASVADFFAALRFSSDGGSTYLQGASDYVGWGEFTGAGSSSVNASTVGSFVTLTGTTDTALPDVGIEGDLVLVQGSASRRPRGRCKSTLYNGSDYYMMDYALAAVGTYAATHMAISASVAGNAFDSATAYVLEGSHG